MSTLRILAAAHESAAVHWVRLGGKAGGSDSGNGRPGDLARHDDDTVIELIIPAERTSLIPVKLAPDQISRLSESNLQWLVEPLVSQELDQLHLVRGALSADGILTVFAVDRNWLQATITGQSERQLQPDRLLLEILLIDWQPQTWTLLLKPEGGFVRSGEQCALILDRHSQDAPPMVLQMAVRAPTPPTEIRVHQSSVANSDDYSRWSSQLGIPVVAGGTIDWRSAPGKKTIDLAQGAFSPRGQMRNFAARLKLAAWLLAGIVGVNLLASGIKTALNQQEKTQLENAIEGVLRKAVPSTTAILDPLLQMRKNLALSRASTGSASGNDFLPLVAKLKTVVGPQLAGKLEALSFTAEQSIEFTIGDPALAQQAGESLKAAGFNLQTEAVASSKSVRIRVKLSS
jgi:type II secretion system protein L